MNFYWIKTPQIIKRLFSNQVWDIPNTENKIYLTFDDGQHQAKCHVRFL
ncbi:hypothetical protein [Flavobacterium swingsii]